MTKYLAQKALAARYGMDSKAFGKVLTEVGLKDGTDASEKAVVEGFTSELMQGSYGPYYKWNVEAVNVLLKNQLGLDVASDADKALLKRIKEIKDFWKSAVMFMDIDRKEIYFSMIEVDTIPVKEIMQELPKMAYFRNKELCYIMVAHLHGAYIEHEELSVKYSYAREFIYTKENKSQMASSCVELFGMTLDEVIQYAKEH